MNYSSPTQLAPLTSASLPQVSEACISLVSIVLSSHREDLHGFKVFLIPCLFRQAIKRQGLLLVKHRTDAVTGIKALSSSVFT